MSVYRTVGPLVQVGFLMHRLIIIIIIIIIINKRFFCIIFQVNQFGQTRDKACRERECSLLMVTCRNSLSRNVFKMANGRKNLCPLLVDNQSLLLGNHLYAHEKYLFFLVFPKHRLWVLVRTALANRF